LFVHTYLSNIKHKASKEYFQDMGMIGNLSVRWRVLPLFFRLLFRRAVPCAPKRIRSVACLRPGKLGDMIVATPLFAALKERGGVERLAVLCSAANEVVIRHNPRVDVLRPVNFHRIGDVFAATAWLRRQRFDAIIDLSPGFSRTNFLMSYFGGPKAVRAGIEKEYIADRYHVHDGGRDTHLADRMLEAGEALTGMQFGRDRRFEICTAPGDREAALSFVNKHRGGGTLVAINLSAGTIQRQWGFEHYAGLVRLIASPNAPVTMALIGIGEQRQWAEKIAAGNPACIVVPQFPFLTVVEVIGACSLLISPDTALVHAAGAHGVPVVGLYTAHAENFTRWGPYHAAGRVVLSSSTDDITSITPHMVADAARELMKDIGLSAP
jgi:heptosyltransferase III